MLRLVQLKGEGWHYSFSLDLGLSALVMIQGCFWDCWQRDKAYCWHYRLYMMMQMTTVEMVYKAIFQVLGLKVELILGLFSISVFKICSSSRLIWSSSMVWLTEVSGECMSTFGNITGWLRQNGLLKFTMDPICVDM